MRNITQGTRHGKPKVNNGRAKIDKGLPFSFEQVLEAIRPQSNGGPAGFTSIEFANHFGIGQGAAQQRIKIAVLSGKLRCNGYRQAKTVDGRAARSPVYVVA